MDLPAAFDEANYDLFITKLQMHGGCFSKLLGSKAICICPTVAIVWTSLTLYLIRKYSNCAIVFLKAHSFFYSSVTCPKPGIFEMTFLLMMLLSILAPPLYLIQWVKRQLDLSFSLWQKEIMYDCLCGKDKIHFFFEYSTKAVPLWSDVRQFEIRVYV